MGRMLDTLKQSPQSPAEERAPRPPSAPVESAAPEVEEEMPFIEVGGPREAVTGSPDVLSVPTKEKKSPPPIAAPPPPPSVPVAAPMPEATPETPWAVQFQPWGIRRAVAAPRSSIAAELIAFHQPEHSVSAQYRLMLRGLLAHLPAPRGQVLLFTSPAPWTGTTTVLLNLAITAAHQDECRVAAVDANLRRPAVAGRLGIAGAPGLRDVLAGVVSLPAAVQPTAQVNLWALSAGRAENGEGRLPFDWLMPTLRQLREQFDLVFVDAPSWNEGSEVSALAATCDAVFMVLQQKDAPQGDASGLAGLRQPPTNLHGCILTVR